MASSPSSFTIHPLSLCYCCPPCLFSVTTALTTVLAAAVHNSHMASHTYSTLYAILIKLHKDVSHKFCILPFPHLVANMACKTQSSGSCSEFQASMAVCTLKLSTSHCSGALQRMTSNANDIAADHHHVAARYQAEMSGKFGMSSTHTYILTLA